MTDEATGWLDDRQWLLAYVGLFLVNTAAMAFLIAPASVLSLAMADLVIGPAAAGWLVSVMYGIQMLASTPFGVALDRIDNRRAIAVATLVMVGGSVWGLWAAREGTFVWLLVSRGTAGLGLVAVWTASTNVVGRGSTDAQRATLLGVFTASAPAGFALAQLTGPLVASGFGWPAVLVAYAPLALVGTVAFWVGSARLDLSNDDGSRASVGDFGRVLTTRRLWHVAVLAFTVYSLYVFVNSWFPTYLTDEFGLSLANSGLLVALFPLVAIVSRIGGGVIADRVFDGRLRPVVLLSFVLSVPSFAALALTGRAAVVLLALVAGGLTVQLSVGLLYAYVSDLVPPNVAATALAFLTAVGLFGSFSAPLVGGLLIELTDSYLPAFGYMGAVLAVGIGLSLLLPRVVAART